MSHIETSPDSARPRIYEHDFVALKRCKHGTFLYNVNDRYIGRSLDLYGEFAERELELLAPCLKPGDVVLDVGANIGTHTVFFAQHVKDQGLVVAFEPQRLAFRNLCANIALNALVNVVSFRQGVGKQTELVPLPVYDPRHDVNFGGVTMRGHANGDPVQIIRIDDLTLGRCDLIKIDVEGMECEVLEGAREMIARYRPALFVENNALDRSAATISLIDSLGYDAYWHIANCYQSENYFRNPTNVFADQADFNLLCFHRSQPATVDGVVKVTGPDDTFNLAWERMGKR